MFLKRFLSTKDESIKRLAKEKFFTYVDADENSYLVAFLKNSGKELKRRTYRSFLAHHRLSRAIRGARRASTYSDEAITRAYDEEYGSDNTRYGYTSIILSPEGFFLVSGINSSHAPPLKILDVGAGSNEFLRFCKNDLGVPGTQLYGVDISSHSKRIVDEDGCMGYSGRIEEVDLPKNFFDVVYLSYFIDYDTNQEATFNAVIDRIKPGGVIVLEGLFPVRPFALLEKDSNTFSFVTKGNNISEDVTLVMESFQRIGQNKGKCVALTKVTKTHRFVRSHYGFKRLSSHFLTFAVT